VENAGSRLKLVVTDSWQRGELGAGDVTREEAQLKVCRHSARIESMSERATLHSKIFLWLSSSDGIERAYIYAMHLSSTFVFPSCNMVNPDVLCLQR
jgi:hypothetical protein